jgi:cation:H+ antiporter
MDFLFALGGLLILLFAGDALVRGAVNLSLRLGVPALIVSLTIVAFGTSAPELLISVQAVLDEVPGIALGNVVGSNIANVLLVLGIPAILSRLHTSNCETQRDFINMLGATVLFVALAFMGPFSWPHAIVLLTSLSLFLVGAFRSARRHRRNGIENGIENGGDELEEVEGADPRMPYWRIWFFLIVGLVGLPLGADILIDSSASIARSFGISESVIGLTLVAFGTSMPELATTVMAALRRQADVALGNVIGSNLFNLLAIIGIAALVGPIPVDPEVLRFDLWVMLASSLFLIPFVFLNRDIGRSWGIGLTALYIIYVLILLN